MNMPEMVAVTVSEAVEVIYEDELLHPDDSWEFIRSLILDGYKVSLSSNLDNGSFSCYVTGKNDTVNKGYCMGQWGGTIESAIRKVHLVHSVLSPKQWWKDADKEIRKTFKIIAQNFKASK